MMVVRICMQHTSTVITNAGLTSCHATSILQGFSAFDGIHSALMSHQQQQMLLENNKTCPRVNSITEYMLKLKVLRNAARESGSRRGPDKDPQVRTGFHCESKNQRELVQCKNKSL
jgi:hypothetical protein